MDIEKYIFENFKDEFETVQNSKRANVLPHLTIFEKTVIYKYTDDDFTYLGLNKQLRHSKGQIISEFAQHLDNALSKIESHVGLVYRSTDLPEEVFEDYKTAYRLGTFYTEYGFFSSSQSEFIAKENYVNDYSFKIFSKTGKPIEKIAKFGVNSFDNEYEVLFRKNTRFKVLEITKFQKYTLITLREV
jgi:ADP-ribosyltransferase exoenzyme